MRVFPAEVVSENFAFPVEMSKGFAGALAVLPFRIR
jgi:hypothetical protein